MDIKPIETGYNDYRFRSRLEARYAVFFDVLGVEYQYEPEGYDLGEAGWYLPDFYLPKHNAFIEVKGQSPTKEEVEKLYTLGDQKKCLVFLFEGLPGLPNLPKYTNWEGFKVHLNSDLFEFYQMFFTTPVGYCAPKSFGNHLVCPYCGFEYVHFESPVYDSGNDHAGSAWEGRGPAIRIPMYCENYHYWTLRFGFHKGYTFAKIEDPYIINQNFLLYVSEDVDTDINEAEVKAKRARFEHGENGFA